VNRRWSINILLLLVLAGLGALALLRPGVERNAHKPPLTSIAAEEIRTLRIEERGKPPVELERTDRWRLKAPLRARANEFNVNDVLRVAAASVEKQLPHEAMQQAAKYGLDSPRVRLHLNGHTIDFGTTNPVNNFQYVAWQGRVYLISVSTLWSVTRAWTDFIDHAVLDATRKPVAISLPNLKLVLQDGRWQLTPRNDRITTDRINRFVEEWRHAHALRVKPYEGGRPLGEIRFTYATKPPLAKPETLRLGILSRTEELVLYRPDEGLQYHFPEDSIQRLLHLTAD
jgi:hypothetical protein